MKEDKDGWVYLLPGDFYCKVINDTATRSIFTDIDYINYYYNHETNMLFCRVYKIERIINKSELEADFNIYLRKEKIERLKERIGK
jgi:hypothetical protein